MKMNSIIGACLLLASTCIYAEATFVGIGELDQVFLNYDKDGDAGWKAPVSKALVVKVAAGSVLASKEPAAANEGADKAFDGSAQTKYCTHASAIWLQRHFEDGQRRIVAYGLTSANDFPKRDPRSWTLQGSNDGRQWDVIDQRTDETFSKRFQRRQFEVKDPGDYAWYQLDVTHNQGAGTTQLAELQLLTTKEAEARTKDVVTPVADAADWTPLFEGDLSDAEFPAGVWTIENGELTASQDKLIYTKQAYENFVLDLEFKNGPAANSGVFVYLSDPKGWVKNSVEIQITDDSAAKWEKANPTWKCGAIFGRLAPSEQMVKPAGEWNRYTIICRGPFIEVILNGTHVNSMDMRNWDSETHNPDRSKKPPWLSKPLNTLPTKGRIGLQGKHGGAPIWFRNVRIKALD